MPTVGPLRPSDRSTTREREWGKRGLGGGARYRLRLLMVGSIVDGSRSDYWSRSTKCFFLRV